MNPDMAAMETLGRAAAVLIACCGVCCDALPENGPGGNSQRHALFFQAPVYKAL